MDVAEALLLCHKIKGKARAGEINLEEVFGESIQLSINQSRIQSSLPRGTGEGTPPRLVHLSVHSTTYLVPSYIETIAKHKKRRGLVYLLGF
jgi:hypothetical protein